MQDKNNLIFYFFIIRFYTETFTTTKTHDDEHPRVCNRKDLKHG